MFLKFVLLALTTGNFLCQLRAETLPQCLTKPAVHAVRRVDLIQTIVFLKKATNCAMIAEIVKNPALEIRLSPKPSLEDNLNQLVRQAPGYNWKADHGVISIFNVRLHASAGNAMNLRLPYFNMPATLSDLKLYLPNAVQSAATGEGGLINGLGVPKESDAPLQQKRYKDLTVREVVEEALIQAGNGFSFVVFANNKPARKTVGIDPFPDWELMSGEGVRSYRYYESVNRMRPH